MGIAIALSLLDFVRRSWYPHDAVLGRVENLKGYHDTRRHPDARLIPGLVIYRFDAPLFFANADHFRDRVAELAAGDGIRRVLVAAEPITDIDTTAGEAIAELLARARRGRASRWRSPSSRARCTTTCGATASSARSARQRFYPTLGVAVAAYVTEAGVDWTDWEDRGPG